MGKRLPNYVRSWRLRSALSQKELAYLMGLRSGASVLRVERFDALFSVDRALACEIIFGVDVRRVFSGTYASVAMRIARRAEILKRVLTRQPETRQREAKLITVDAIIQRVANVLGL